MKKILFICFFWATSALAAPFLVCDTDSEATSYVYVEVATSGIHPGCGISQVEGKEEVVVAAPLYYDLSSLTRGTHHWCVKARNDSGDSDYVPYQITRAAGGAGVGMSAP
jgi:hypothetical protein